MRHQEILFNVSGQSFYYDPPETFQPSGTPTVDVWLATNDDTLTAETATTGSCSVDSVSTTFSASAGASSITVASGTGITKGRRYLVTDTDGTAEHVEVMSVSGTTVGLRHPLVNTYAASSTFKGTRISIGVNSTWVANAANLTDVLTGAWRTDQEPDPNMTVGQAGYRLRWAYTVNGVATIGYSFADLIRYQAKNLVTPLDVDARFPGWIDRLSPDYREDQGAALVLEAFHAVRMDAVADAVLLRRVRNTEILRELVILRANQIALENQALAGAGNAEAVALARDIYKQRYDQLVREPKFPTDAGGGGASAQSPRLPVFRR